MSIKTPRLILDRCGVFYFRFVVPLALRQSVGKTEFRRSLKTKDSAIARQRALALCVAVETVMFSPKITDFPHLLKVNAKQGIREKIRIDLPNGIIETDTPEEAAQAVQIVANLAKARESVAASGIAAVLPTSKCGTNLEKAKGDYLAERKATLQDSTWRKHRGVLQAFIKAMGNIDVAMVSALTVGDFKKKLLALKRAATTVNDQMTILGGFFDYCIDNKVVNMVNPAKGLFIVGASNKAESYETFKESDGGDCGIFRTYDAGDAHTQRGPRWRGAACALLGRWPDTIPSGPPSA